MTIRHTLIHRCRATAGTLTALAETLASLPPGALADEEAAAQVAELEIVEMRLAEIVDALAAATDPSGNNCSQSFTPN